MQMALLVVVAIKKEKNEKGKVVELEKRNVVEDEKGKVVELEKKNEEKDKFY